MRERCSTAASARACRSCTHTHAFARSFYPFSSIVSACNLGEWKQHNLKHMTYAIRTKHAGQHQALMQYPRLSSCMQLWLSNASLNLKCLLPVSPE